MTSSSGCSPRFWSAPTDRSKYVTGVKERRLESWEQSIFGKTAPLNGDLRSVGVSRWGDRCNDAASLCAFLEGGMNVHTLFKNLERSMH